MAKSIRIPLAGLALTTLALAAAAQSSNVQAAQTRDYHIESQPLPAAVNEWADQAGLQVMWSAQMPGAQREAPEVAGRFSAPVALERVLQGSGLTFAFLDEQTVAIRLASAAGQASAASGTGGPETRMSSPAQGEDTGADPKTGESRGDDSKQSVRGADSAAVSKAETISEIIVTGTHLRNSAPAGSPIRAYSRDEIDASGALTTEQFTDLIPQNFGGGISEDTSSTFVPSDKKNTLNRGKGTGINLRGLGSDATLVLVNGHRLSQTGAGGYVDVSQIPFSAIERIDVLTDGASAVYGSDAVAGVVNIILKQNFSGAETRLRYGSVTDGDFSRYGLGQTVGAEWGHGSALLTYDFFKQDNLNREDRPFARQPTGDLLPEKTNHNALLSGLQQIGPTTLRYDAIYSHRSAESVGPENLVSTFADTRDESPSESYSASGALDIPMHGTWNALLGAVYSSADVESQSHYIATGLPLSQLFFNNSLRSVNVNLAGDAGSIGDRPLRVVIGADYREERFESRYVSGGSITKLTDERTIKSAFAEASVPLGPVDVSAAVRHEEYSDFGSTTVPKIGISWALLEGVKIRASFGKSFRAPAFDQQTDSSSAVVLISLPDPTPSQSSLALVRVGNSTDLDAEKATTWTVGFDWMPPALDGFKLGFGYFDTEYRGRIQEPTSNPFGVLADEAVFSSLITRNPSAAVIDQAISNPGGLGFINAGPPGTTAQDAVVLVDVRTQNTAESTVRGFDLGLSHVATWGGVAWRLSLDATRFITYENRFTPDAPSAKITGTVFNPPKWRVRSGLGASVSGFAADLFLQYTPSYINDLTIPEQGISKFTSVDATFAYSFGDSTSNVFRSSTVSLSIQNLFNEAPPYVAGTGTIALMPVGYDAANASPLRRFISLELRKRF